MPSSVRVSTNHLSRPVLVFWALGALGCGYPGLKETPHRSPAELQLLAGDAAIDRMHWEDAQLHYQRSLALAQNSGQKWEEALAQNQLGVLAERLGNLVDAEHHYLGSRRLQQVHELHGKELFPAVNLANVCLAQNRHQAALELAREALGEIDAAADPDAAARALRIQGEAEIGIRDFEAARSSLLHAITLFQRARSPSGEASARFVLGQMLLLKGAPKEAIAHLSIARTAFATFKSLESELRALRALACAYQMLEQDEMALGFWERAAERAGELNDRGARKECLEHGISLLARTGRKEELRRWQEALDLLQPP